MHLQVLDGTGGVRALSFSSRAGLVRTCSFATLRSARPRFPVIRRVRAQVEDGGEINNRGEETRAMPLAGRCVPSGHDREPANLGRWLPT
jgi:hypothetical protein